MRAIRPGEGSSTGPGVSRWAFRLSRAWKKAWLRQGVLFVLPVLLLIGVGLRLVSDPDVQARLSAQAERMVALLSMRPEFAVQRLDVVGASVEVSREIRELAEVRPGMSSLNLDVGDLKTRIEKIGAVRTANVVLGSDGVLRVDVSERIPAALWRDADQKLWLVDREGEHVSRAMTRLGYPELPVLIGDGAKNAVGEGLALLAASDDLRDRVRAFVRVGERRWDVVLSDDLRIMLPEVEPGQALSRVIAWHYGDEVLDRDLSTIDMRLPARPILRMREEALELYRLRKAADGKGEDT